ncbi:MAG: hypothetical protein IKS90_07950 [Clostridia bacterium]|nr:hypothetical protein [Clostridia bacterium]
MKKIIAVILAVLVVASAFVGCKKAETEDKKGEGVMTHAEYMAAALDSKVVVETYVQAKQSWWEDKATIYTQDHDGAYFIYEMACSEADYEKLVPGTKIKVTGTKSEWSGEIEIVDATFEIEKGSFTATAVDLTSVFGKDELEKHQNELFTVKGAVVEAVGQNDDGSDAAFFYKWDNSGEDGDDLYFKLKIGDASYTFTVESYLCDKTTDVYAAVKNLKIGDTVDVTGFLYWYNGANPHVTAVKTK